MFFVPPQPIIRRRNILVGFSDFGVDFPRNQYQPPPLLTDEMACEGTSYFVSRDHWSASSRTPDSGLEVQDRSTPIPSSSTPAPEQATSSQPATKEPLEAPTRTNTNPTPTGSTEGNASRGSIVYHTQDWIEVEDDEFPDVGPLDISEPAQWVSNNAHLRRCDVGCMTVAENVTASSVGVSQGVETDPSPPDAPPQPTTVDEGCDPIPELLATSQLDRTTADEEPVAPSKQDQQGGKPADRAEQALGLSILASEGSDTDEEEKAVEVHRSPSAHSSTPTNTPGVTPILKTPQPSALTPMAAAKKKVLFDVSTDEAEKHSLDSSLIEPVSTLQHQTYFHHNLPDIPAPMEGEPPYYVALFERQEASCSMSESEEVSQEIVKASHALYTGILRTIVIPQALEEYDVVQRTKEAAAKSEAKEGNKGKDHDKDKDSGGEGTVTKTSSQLMEEFKQKAASKDGSPTGGVRPTTSESTAQLPTESSSFQVPEGSPGYYTIESFGTNEVFQGFLDSTLSSEVWEGRKVKVKQFTQDFFKRVVIVASAHMRHPGLKQASGFLRMNGTSPSYISPQDGLYVHIWSSTSQARRFAATQRYQWQCIADTGIQMISLPLGGLVTYRGALVTVTQLVPLLSSNPISEKDIATRGAMLGTYAAQLRVALRRGLGFRKEEFHFGDAEPSTPQPPATPALSGVGVGMAFGPGAKIPLYQGADGRFYAIGVDHVFQYRFRQPKGESSFEARPEMIPVLEALSAKTKQKELTQSQVKEQILQRVPQAAAKIVADLSTQQNVPEYLAALGVSTALHSAGVNIQFLYAVLADPAISESSTPAAKAAAEAILYEMALRTIKELGRADLRGRRDEEDAKAVMRLNRLLTLCLVSKSGVWQEQVNPVLRRKFGCPSDFKVPLSPSLIRIVNLRFQSKMGIIYDAKSSCFRSMQGITLQLLYYGLPSIVLEVMNLRVKEGKNTTLGRVASSALFGQAVGDSRAKARTSVVAEAGSPSGLNRSFSIGSGGPAAEPSFGEMVAETEGQLEQNESFAVGSPEALNRSGMSFRRNSSAVLRQGLSQLDAGSQLMRQGTIAVLQRSNAVEYVKNSIPSRTDIETASHRSSVSAGNMALTLDILSDLIRAARCCILIDSLEEACEIGVEIQEVLESLRPGEPLAPLLDGDCRRVPQPWRMYLAFLIQVVDLHLPSIDDKYEEELRHLLLAMEATDHQDSLVASPTGKQKKRHGGDESKKVSEGFGLDGWLVALSWRKCAGEKLSAQNSDIVSVFRVGSLSSWVDKRIPPWWFNTLLEAASLLSAVDDATTLAQLMRWAVDVRPTTDRQQSQLLVALRKVASAVVQSQEPKAAVPFRDVALRSLQLHEKKFGLGAFQTGVGLSQAAYIAGLCLSAKLTLNQTRDLRRFQSITQGFGTMTIAELKNVLSSDDYLAALGAVIQLLSDHGQLDIASRGLHNAFAFQRPDSSIPQVRKASRLLQIRSLSLIRNMVRSKKGLLQRRDPQFDEVFHRIGCEMVYFDECLKLARRLAQLEEETGRIIIETEEAKEMGELSAIAAEERDELERQELKRKEQRWMERQTLTAEALDGFVNMEEEFDRTRLELEAFESSQRETYPLLVDQIVHDESTDRDPILLMEAVESSQRTERLQLELLEIRKRENDIFWVENLVFGAIGRLHWQELEGLERDHWVSDWAADLEGLSVQLRETMPIPIMKTVRPFAERLARELRRSELKAIQVGFGILEEEAEAGWAWIREEEDSAFDELLRLMKESKADAHRRMRERLEEEAAAKKARILEERRRFREARERWEAGSKDAPATERERRRSSVTNPNPTPRHASNEPNSNPEQDSESRAIDAVLEERQQRKQHLQNIQQLHEESVFRRFQGKIQQLFLAERKRRQALQVDEESRRLSLQSEAEAASSKTTHRDLAQQARAERHSSVRLRSKADANAVYIDAQQYSAQSSLKREAVRSTESSPSRADRSDETGKRKDPQPRAANAGADKSTRKEPSPKARSSSPKASDRASPDPSTSPSPSPTRSVSTSPKRRAIVREQQLSGRTSEVTSKKKKIIQEVLKQAQNSTPDRNAESRPTASAASQEAEHTTHEVAAQDV
jgi:hypothetical protein